MGGLGARKTRGQRRCFLSVSAQSESNESGTSCRCLMNHLKYTIRCAVVWIFYSKQVGRMLVATGGGVLLTPSEYECTQLPTIPRYIVEATGL